jgi:hypothetical protein
MTKELFNVGIKVPTDFSLNVMRKLYTENTNKSIIVTSVDECNSNDNIEESTEAYYNRNALRLTIRKRLSDTGFPMFLTHDICV